MKEDNKTGEQKLEERGLAPTEKQEGGRPGSPDHEAGKDLLEQARDLLKRWTEMHPGHRGLVLAAVDMDLVLGEDGIDSEATKVNTGAVAIIGIVGAANLAAIMAMKEKESLRLAREYFEQD